MEQSVRTFLFYLGHPAHYHNVSKTIEHLTNMGHKVILVARSKDVLFSLLKGLPYKVVYLKSRKGKGKLSLIATVLKRQFALLFVAIKYKPGLLVGTDIVITHIGKLLRIPSIILNEDDAAEVPFLAKYGFKYASAVLSPISCNISPYERKKVEYQGYHELAYLHPKYFTPNRSLVEDLFGQKGKYFILRFAELTAHHDKGRKGIDTEIALKLVKNLEQYGHVYITSERELQPALDKYRIKIDPKHIHHAISFASLYIGDSQTMSAESAVLGTPSIRFNDFVGKLGYLEELEHKYQLTFGIPTDKPHLLYQKVDELVKNESLEQIFSKRKETMLKDTIDVTQFWVKEFMYRYKY